MAKVIAVLLMLLIGAVSGVGYMLHAQHQHTLQLEAQAEAERKSEEHRQEIQKIIDDAKEKSRRKRELGI